MLTKLYEELERILALQNAGEYEGQEFECWIKLRTINMLISLELRKLYDL